MFGTIRMDNRLNREILRLAIPSIFANLTVPLVGMVDTAIAGHLRGENAAAMIGAIALGSTLFNLIYWNFGFLRTGTGGLTAQSYGRGDSHECARIFVRAEILALAAAALILILQWPIGKVFPIIVNSSSDVTALTLQYFFIRVWAAPATMSLMAFSGWFVGMQDSISSMWKDFIVNGVNIVASTALTFGAGMGFKGIVWGTVIAQYSGLLFCIATAAFKYRDIFRTYKFKESSELFKDRKIGGFFKMNADLIGRSAGFTAIYIGYTVIAAQYGDTILACSSIMMQILMIFSYFTDGFAYAGEALTGLFIGAGDAARLKRSVKYIFVWSMGIAVLFIGIYAVCGVPILHLLTSDIALADACKNFLLWLLIMPPLGCAAFTWDGIYLGATASGDIRDAMLGSAACFLAFWFACRMILQPTGNTALHCLLAAYFIHLLFRTVLLTVRRKGILPQ